MKTFSPSRLGIYLSVLVGLFAIILPAEAQAGQVTVRGRKASDSGLLARVRDGANPGKLQAAKGGLGQAAMTTKAEFRTKGLMLVGKNAQGAAAAMTSAELELKAKELMATGLYDYVEPDWIVTVSQVPTDSAYSNGSLWGLRNTGQSGGVVGVDVNAQAAWAVTTGSPTVIVGVVDTGIRFTHQDLVGNIWVNPGEIAANGIDDDANGYIDDVHGINGITNTGNPMDDNNHGTHCAGTIGATANNAGQIVGVAWNVKLMGLKFLSASGSGNTSDAIKCIDYGVAKGAHILSNSWGGGGYSQALRDSIAAASSAGVLFVAAAGNSSSNNDVTQSYPSNYDPVNVVAVAAVDRTGALASFSSYGATTVDVGAPGVAILSSTAASDTSYDTYNGTSMATPHVAGVAALIKSQFPAATMLEIKNRLMATTRPLASLAGRTVSGGIVDAHAALTVAADGVLELRASAATSPLRNGVITAFYVTVSDLTPVTGATVTGALGAATPVAFLDNGVAPDGAANDGTYSANLTVPAIGSSTTLNVTASNGAAPASAAFPFSIISPPGNDDFVNRVLLAAGTTQATGSNRLSTFETGEPQFPSVAGTKSVWWEWAAGTTGSITVTTSGSDYDTTLAIYSGSGTLASLVHLGSNDDFSGLASSVTFSATSGQRYYVQVNGYSSAEGSITLNYPAPANVNSPPVIVTQPAGTILVAGDPLALSVTASGTAPLTYQWRLNGSSIVGATSASYAVASVAEVDEGNYTVTITNAFGSLTSATAFVGVDPISVRPPNDLFASAETLPGAAGRVNGTNLRASAETGEPNHAAASTPVESVWYRWTAPAAGTLSVDTYGSSLDTTLAAYTGAVVNALTQRAANNDAGGVQSFISVAVTAGEVLQIAVDGAGTAESIFSLNYFFQPTVPGLANDAFASRTVVSGAGGAFTGSNISATGEVGEPVHEASAPPTASAWWSWTAPANGVAVIDTLGSDFDTVVAVYTGTAVTALTLVASNDDAGGPQSRVGFSCAVGTAYGIAVDGRGAAQGLVSLNITSGATEPEIVVEQPVGTGLVDGGAGVSWGNLATTENATRTFTVRNTGGARLTGITVQIEGTNAADYVLTTPPATAVNGGASTTFSIRFTPAGLGARTALVRLASNDGDENPFDISLSGTGVPPAPEIVLEEPVGTGLVDGSATTAFGSVVVGNSASKAYTVRNTGTATLSGLAVTFSGANAADFSVTTPPTATVAPGASTIFIVRFAPAAVGVRTAGLHLASNDDDENPFDIALSGRGYTVPVGLDFQILSLGTTGAAVVDHNTITGDDRGGIAVTMDRVFVTGDNATSRHALDLTGGASIGRVSDGLCSDIGSGAAYVLAHSGVETTGSGTVSQLIQLDPLTGALTGTLIPLSTSFTITSGSGVFSGNGRVVVHNGTRVYDILVPSGVVTDMGPMTVSSRYGSESWANWGVAEFFNGELHLAYRASSGSTIVRSRVPDGLVQTIATFSNLNDLASWTVSPVTGRWYFHYENSSQFGGSSETIGYADATFAIGPPTQPPAITSNLAATAFTGSAFSYQISASRSPTSYNAAGLPTGLSVNTATGIISGSVAVVGVYPVTISATNIIGTTSETLTLTVMDTLTTFFDDFDPGIDTSLWSGFGGTVTANTAGQAAGAGSTGNSMHFDGSGSRFAITVEIDTRGTDAMYFLFALANGSGSSWENADPGEEVVLEYSTDGVAFTQVGGPYSNRVWQLTTVALPMAAKTASTRFRWRQLSNSGVGFDHWAIEDVRIAASVIASPEIAVEQPAGTGLTDGVSTVSYGPVETGTSASLTFTVRNSGGANLIGLVPTINGANAGDFTVTTAPASTVAPGSTTTFIVRFAPGAAGARTAALHIASNDADENPFDIALAGTGFILAPEIAVEQPVDTNLLDGVSTVAFGIATITTSSQRTFTVRNTGTAPLTGIAVAFGGSHIVDWTLTTAPASTVAAGASTTFTARFSPTALGERTATLQISSNDGDENPFDLVLVGFAANETTVLVNFDGVFAPTSFAEQTRPTSDYAPGSITFTNTTMEVLNEGGGFGVAGHSSPNFLAWSANPGANNSVTMVFPVPVSGFSLKAAVGLTDTATVSAYDSSDALLYSTTVPLSATLTTVALPSSQVSRVVFTTAGTVGVIDDISYRLIVPPEIAIEQPAGVNLTDGASTVSFDPAAMPVTRQFTVRNIGDGQSLNVSAPTINGAHAADFTITTLPSSTVAPTGFTTFAVRFTPSAPGARTAALHLGNNDADENPFDIALTATSITAASGFDAWLPAGLSDRTPLGIPHQDGVPNLLKYAFNLNPNAPDYRVMSPGGIAGLPSFRRTQAGNATVFRFEFIRRIGSGLAYTPQKRDSLTAVDWTALSSLPVATPVDELWERVVYEEPVNPLTVPACYGRVHIHLP